MNTETSTLTLSQCQHHNQDNVDPTFQDVKITNEISEVCRVEKKIESVIPGS